MTIVLPENLDRRPKYKGLPVPFTVPWDNGVPDFKGTDYPRWREAVDNRLCHMCGERINGYIALIGGEKTRTNLLFFDGPMHEACARAASVLCPFISMRRDYSRSTADLPLAAWEAKGRKSMHLTLAHDYRLVRMPPDATAIDGSGNMLDIAIQAIGVIHQELIPRARRGKQ